jgi:hypothetical protein
MIRVIIDTMLFSCMAAMVIGVVIVAATFLIYLRRTGRGPASPWSQQPMYRRAVLRSMADHGVVDEPRH